MNFTFTTLAIGQQYFETAKQFSIDLYNKNINFSRIIVSDISDTDTPNTLVITPPIDTVTRICNAFNYNLKYLALDAAVQYLSSANCDYIIYIDADWRIRDNYDNNKIIKFLNQNLNIDFYFERPHNIGVSKLNLDNNCFWKHKIHPYGLLNTTKYDSAHVCNEQFMIFKNNKKLEKFVESWSEKNQFCIENNVWTFAEGVEMGMSYIDANMLAQYTNFGTINDCFEFNDASGNLHVRF